MECSYNECVRGCMNVRILDGCCQNETRNDNCQNGCGCECCPYRQCRQTNDSCCD